MSDFIKNTVGRFQNLEFQPNKGEKYRVRNYKYKGSLWINERYKGFRLQTTSDVARILNGEIERLAGEAQGSEKPQEYKYWYINDHNVVEKILEYFGRS